MLDNKNIIKNEKYIHGLEAPFVEFLFCWPHVELVLVCGDQSVVTASGTGGEVVAILNVKKKENL